MFHRLFGLITSIAFAVLSNVSFASVVPLENGHAHNDYNHVHPFWDAVGCGFCSIEADVHLAGGALLVGHDKKGLKPERTLAALYLEPLRRLATTNHGRIYSGGPEVKLLIDLKDHWTNLYPVLRKELENYASVLSSFSSTGKVERAVCVIITGDRSVRMFDGETVRLACIDGEPVNLKQTPLCPREQMPIISANWRTFFRWQGKGTMTEAEQARLSDLVAQAHAQGRVLRFWGAPDFPAFWEFLLDRGVDIINTDDLKGFSTFMEKRRAAAAPRHE